EQERQRVARELHDRVGSMLSTVKLHLSQLESEGVGLTPTNQLVDDTCEEVRRISHNLEAGALAEHGLLSALEDLISSLQTHADFTLEVHLFGLEQPLAPQIERHLFAIIQEGFNNVVKYAQASEVHLSLTRHSDHLNLMLEDNGIGFELAAAQAKNGIGLRNLQHRAAQMGGEVLFDTQTGRGTTLIVDVPLEGEVGAPPA
ncbi:MAG: sensor histidine kinase, partial [Bacteroidota bacterium]